MCLALSGMMIAIRLKKRVALLEETVNFFSAVKLDLEYTGANVYDLVYKASQSQLCRKLDYLSECCSLMQKGFDFPVAWQTALKNSTLYYTDEERRMLSCFGNSFGTTDITSQSTILSMYMEYFKGYYNISAGLYAKYGNLSCFLGLMLGFGIFIMII